MIPLGEADLVLLHPPSFYDFRKRSFLYGPVSDVVPSSSIFEMYPLGFSTILGYLEGRGFDVRIVNLAAKMLQDPSYDPEEQIRSLRAKAFGVDLHWLVHTQGSLEVARLLKKHHGETTVIFGGLTASYFHMQLVKSPYVDIVVRGDSTEPILERLLEVELKAPLLRAIPNLTYKDEAGKTQVNPLSFVPENLDYISYGFSSMVRSVLSHREIRGYLPYRAWLESPVGAVFLCRGCNYDCKTCGGSRSAYRRFYGRERPAFRSPERVVEDLADIRGYMKGPIFLISDLRQAGKEYAERLLREIRREKVEGPLVFEFFTGVDKETASRLARCCDRFSVEMSPESHDSGVMLAQGKAFTQASVQRSLRNLLNTGCERVDVFFMIGLPTQTRESVLATTKYVDRLLSRFRDDRLKPFIAPLAPYMDPGSIIFESPKENGYTIFFRDLMEYQSVSHSLSWKHLLNYESRWMTRDELVDVTYDAAYRINSVKASHGLISKKEAERQQARITLSWELSKEIDQRLEKGDQKQIEELMKRIFAEPGLIEEYTLCLSTDLRWRGSRIKYMNLVKSLLKR